MNKQTPSTLKEKAKQLKDELLLIYMCYKDPRTPWYSKLLIFMVAAYAFSPIDLIPDFIPVLGYLDDIIILLLGIALAVKTIPAFIIEEKRQLLSFGQIQPEFKWMAAVTIVIWMICVFLLYILIRHFLTTNTKFKS